jgi:alpha-amylase
MLFSNDWIGPPHDSQDANRTVLDVTIDPATNRCLGDWICEHRWPAIARMVEWRNVANGRPLRHWWSGHDGRQAAFSRPGAAFVAFNADRQRPLSATLQTGLPAGRYCDIATGERDSTGRRCTGRTVTVGDDGRATIVVDRATMSADGRDSIGEWFVAMHVGKREMVIHKTRDG